MTRLCASHRVPMEQGLILGDYQFEDYECPKCLEFFEMWLEKHDMIVMIKDEEIEEVCDLTRHS